MEAMKISSGIDIICQCEESVSGVESPHSTERSTLSVLEAAVKIWADWKLCEKLIMHPDSCFKINDNDPG